MNRRKPAPAKACAYYIRVSSRSQDYGMQATAITRAAAARGDEIARVFSEKRTAKTTDRPELKRLLSAVAAGEIRKLYVYRLDRLTRSGIRDTLDVVHALDRGGCALVTLADSFPVDGPTRDLVLAVLGWAADFERRAIGERIATAREHHAAVGRPWGRPPSISPELLSRAWAMRDGGETIRGISAALKIKRSTLSDALRADQEIRDARKQS